MLEAGHANGGMNYFRSTGYGDLLEIIANLKIKVYID